MPFWELVPLITCRFLQLTIIWVKKNLKMLITHHGRRLTIPCAKQGEGAVGISCEGNLDEIEQI